MEKVIKMEKQRTAVDWLFQMLNNPNSDCYLDPNSDQEFAKKLLDKAKEMEKEQVIEAWEDGQDSFSSRTAEKYYNETFKN